MPASDVAHEINRLIVVMNVLSLLIIYLLYDLIRSSVKEKRFLSLFPERSHYVLHGGITYFPGPFMPLFNPSIMAANFVVLVTFILYAVVKLNGWSQIDSEVQSYFMEILSHVSLGAAYSLIVFMILVFCFTAHLCLFSVRWWLTPKVIKSTDYFYFLLVIISLVKIVNQYDDLIDFRIDLLSYTFIAAAVGIRLSRTSAEVFGWDEFIKLRVRKRMPVFASRNRLYSIVRICGNCDKSRSDDRNWMTLKSNDPHWQKIFKRRLEVELEFAKKWSQANH